MTLAMKLSSKFASLVLPRLGPLPRWAQALLASWRLERAPALVPVPIRTDPRADLAARRLARRDGWDRRPS